MFTTTVQLAEKIAGRRQFLMKYDFATSVHDRIGRHKGIDDLRWMPLSSLLFVSSVSKVDSMRQIIEHIDQRNWRALDYFRMLEKRTAAASDNHHSSAGVQSQSVENIHRRLTERLVQPLTYKSDSSEEEEEDLHSLFPFAEISTR